MSPELYDEEEYQPKAESDTNLNRGDKKCANDIITEDNAAMQFAELYGSKLRYCHDSGAWFQFNGLIWRRIETNLAFQWARQLARELAQDRSSKVRYVTSKTNFAAGVERFAKSDPAFAVTIKHWDQDPYLLGTPGGTVDLRTGELRSADPADGISKSTSVAPTATAECPGWLKFLYDATGGDGGLIRFMQQWCGYALTGDTREHALVFVFGDGGNGKSVFVKVATGILGDYSATASMDTFTASDHSRHPTDIASLRGARLVTSSETEKGRPWAEAKIKQLTGGDTISARFMRQDPFEFQPQFKLTIVGNHKPMLSTVDEATRRRFNLVPFTHKPPVPDLMLETKLRAEWPGILRWMIDGCLDWQQHGLIRPTSVLDATSDYFAAQDVIGQWLDESCDCEPGNPWKRATSGELFTSWTAFAKAAGEQPGSQKTFSETLQARGFEKHKGTGGVREFRGIMLKPLPTTDFNQARKQRDEDFG